MTQNHRVRQQVKGSQESRSGDWEVSNDADGTVKVLQEAPKEMQNVLSGFIYQQQQ